MKKILILLMPLFFLVPFMANAEVIRTPEPHDYNNGLLDIAEFTYESNVADVELIFDNDITTYKYFYENNRNPGYVDFFFRKPVNLDGYYIDSGGNRYGRLKFTYYDEVEETIETHTAPNNRENGYYALDIKNVLKINIVYNYTNYETRFNEIDFFGSISEGILPELEDLEKLEVETWSERISLSWEHPNENVSYIKIFKDGKLIADNIKENEYMIKGLNPETNYKIRVVVVYEDGFESEGLVINATTKPMPEVEEVKNLTIEAEPDRVNLSWELPETDLFEHVNIYRKDLGKNEQEISFFDFLKPMTVHASNDDFRAIFETNGTYFNDLTVEENSKYEYKLTTEYQGLESQGVIVQATTPISPAPPLEGGGGEQQSNGDYLFKWSSPREGQVRVFVDGTEYATVEASTGQLLVPGSDMKYSPLGKPLISYQTIGLNGEESNIISPDISDLEIPVTPGEVIETGGQLIGIVSSFILLGLSFIFAPKLIKFIRQSFSNKKEDSGRGREREQRESRTSIRETRQPRQGRTRTRTPREGRA